MTTILAGLPQLDIHTLSEDWALAAGLQHVWADLARSMGLPPSRWIDSQGDRMYGAVMALRTRIDLVNRVMEDDRIEVTSTLAAIRKPHGWGRVVYAVDGASRVEVDFLTSFIKRNVRGSNKKFSKVRDIWTAPDAEGHHVDHWLETHHEAKSTVIDAPVVLTHEVNRIQDFNTADFMYFKNFVRIAKAAEWVANRGGPTRLNQSRDCYYFGNVEDGDRVHARVARDGDRVTTVLEDDGGRRLFVSLAECPVVEIAVR